MGVSDTRKTSEYKKNVFNAFVGNMEELITSQEYAQGEIIHMVVLPEERLEASSLEEIAFAVVTSLAESG